MRIELDGLGWITGAPAGNRLRWRLVPTPGEPPPPTVRIERQAVKASLKSQPSAAHRAPIAPEAWWTPHDEVRRFGTPPLVHRLPAPVHAVRFRYDGAPGLLRVRATDGRVLADRAVAPGDHVVVQGPGLIELRFVASGIILTGLATLDLTAPPGLCAGGGEPVAELSLAATLDARWEDVRDRLGDGDPEELVVGDAGRWAELVGLARGEAAAPLGRFTPPAPQEVLELLLAVRWQLALLFGMAFCDGPGGSRSALDKVYATPAAAPADPQARAWAYRVVAGDGVSNTVVCPAREAPELQPPGTPEYRRADVRLAAADRLELGSELGWALDEPRAVRVEVEQQVLAAGTGKTPTRFETPAGDSASAAVTVGSWEGHVHARARSRDGWDRRSAWSADSPDTPMALRHAARAPALERAEISGDDDGGVRLVRRTVAEPGEPAARVWEPDTVVLRAAARVAVLRRTGEPAVEGVSMPLDAGAPVPGDAGAFRVELSLALDPTVFAGGILLAPGLRADLLELAGTSALLRFGSDGGATPIFEPGPVRVLQRPSHPALWARVTDFDARGLPEELVFRDGVSDLVSTYCLAVDVLGGLGPLSNTADLLRVPPPLTAPPPFELSVLGIDAFHRTLVQLRFAAPLEAGDYRVTWAAHQPGSGDDLTPGAFAGRAASAVHERQSVPAAATEILEILPLPRSRLAARWVGVGVQRVGTDAGGRRSEIRVALAEVGAPASP